MRVVEVHLEADRLDAQLAELMKLFLEHPADVVQELLDALFSSGDFICEATAVKINAASTRTGPLGVRLQLSNRLLEASAAIRAPQV